LGGRASATLVPGFDVAAVTETDLLERTIPADAADGPRLTLRPFQIVTLRLRPASSAEIRP
jgi:alpha-mannosidase